MFISPYKAIIFDFDETLVQSISIKSKQHQHAARKFYNHELTDETIRAHWGLPFELLIEIFYEKKDTIENMKKNYHSLDDQYPKYPFDDTIQVLTYLQDHFYWTGVITSMTKESVIKDMKKDGLPYKKFNLVQGSTDSIFHKPDPRVFDNALEILRKIHITQSKILYVGDDIRDMQAAQGAGIHFIAIPNGLTPKEEFVKQGVQCIVSLSELIG